MKYTKEILTQIARMRAEGNTWRTISEELMEQTGEDVSASTVRVSFAYHADDNVGDADYNTEKMMQVYRAQKVASTARKNAKSLMAERYGQEDFLSGINKLIRKLPKIKPPSVERAPAKKGTPMTVELLLSDLQIGKIMTDYNTSVAKDRLTEYAQVAIAEIRKAIRNGFKVEKIVLAMLGDIIESAKKHPDSALACDSSTPEQVADSIEAIYLRVILPLSELGIPIHMVGIAGNHDHDGHGLIMFKPGRTQLNWPIYNSLKLLCNAQGIKNMTFDIPDGVFTTVSIYGHNVLYEHGVGVQATEASMQKQVEKRMKQNKKFITYFRMGDKHNNTSINNGRYVVNGAFFGDDNRGVEYSGIMGFDAQAGQTMMFYVARNDARLPLYDSFVIQLQHIK